MMSQSHFNTNLRFFFFFFLMQFYADTVKKMAVCQLVDGSPLRTLCLLIAGQPADVFSSTTNVGSPKGAEKISQQPSQV